MNPTDGVFPVRAQAVMLAMGCRERSRGAVVYQNRETLVGGVFACGNVLQVHDLVDFVSEEAETAGRGAADYVSGGGGDKAPLDVLNGQNISYVLPQKIDKNLAGDVKLFFRVNSTFKNCTIKAVSGDTELSVRKKKIAVPGEMETLILKADSIASAYAPIKIGRAHV